MTNMMTEVTRSLDSDVESCSSLGAISLHSIAKLGKIDSITDLSELDFSIIPIKKNDQITNTNDIGKVTDLQQNLKDTLSCISQTKSKDIHDKSNTTFVDLRVLKEALEENSSFLYDRKLINDLIEEETPLINHNKNKKTNKKLIMEHMEILNPKLEINSEFFDICDKKILEKNKKVSFLQCSDSQLQDTSCVRFQENIRPDVLLKQLNLLQLELGNQVDIDLPFEGDAKGLCHLLFSHLTAQRKRNKELEEQLACIQISLMKVSEQSTSMKAVAENRAIQLKKAADQLGTLHAEWQDTYNKLSTEKKNLQMTCDSYKKEIKVVKSEANTFQGEVMRLRGFNEDVNNLKMTLKKMEKSLKESQSKNRDIIRENESLSQNFKQALHDIKILEITTVPELKYEKNALKEDLQSKEELIKQLEEILKETKGNMKLLENQNKLLLKRYIQEQELHQSAVKNMDILKNKHNEILIHITTMKDDLHNHYQNKLESIADKRDHDVKKTINKRETDIKKEFENKINLIKDSHKSEIDEIKFRHEKLMMNSNNQHLREIENLKNQLSKIKYENAVLKNQQENVAAAVTAIMNPSATTAELKETIPKSHMEDLVTPCPANPIIYQMNSQKYKNLEEKYNCPKLNLEGAASSGLSHIEDNFDKPNEINEKVILSHPSNEMLSSRGITTASKNSVCKTLECVKFSLEENLNQRKVSKQLVLKENIFKDNEKFKKEDWFNQLEDDPTHDTSIEYDPASLTLGKISDLSEMMSKYVYSANV